MAIALNMGSAGNPVDRAEASRMGEGTFYIIINITCECLRRRAGKANRMMPGMNIIFGIFALERKISIDCVDG